jgi:hypothetical protein
MAEENTSSVTEFILIGLTDQPGLQMPLFFLFLGFYVVTVGEPGPDSTDWTQLSPAHSCVLLPPQPVFHRLQLLHYSHP